MDPGPVKGQNSDILEKSKSKLNSIMQHKRLSLEDFLEDCRFKYVNKVNLKKLSKKLNCSDKTAKKLIKTHAPYILE